MSFPERLRQLDNQVFATANEDFNYNGTHYLSSANSPRTIGTSKVIMDNFPTRYKPGELKLSPVDIRKTEVSVTSDSVRFFSWLNFWHINSGAIASINWYPNFSLVNGAVRDSRLDDLASMKAYANVMEPDVNLLENLAEAGKTLKMFVSPMRGIVDLVGQMNKAANKPVSGPRLSPTSKLKASPMRAANAWLQYRYGIMPLVISVEGLRKSYRRHFVPHKSWYRKGGSVISTSESDMESQTSVGNAIFYWKEQAQIENCTRREYFYQSINGLSKDLWSVGAHPRQYLSLAWELIPASFMVDWSVNINDWLKTITPAPHIQFLMSFVSWRQTTSITRFCTKNRSLYGSCIPDKTTSSMGIAQMSKYYRLPGLPSLGTPRLNFDPLNIIRAVDTLSILGQQLSNKLR